MSDNSAFQTFSISVIQFDSTKRGVVNFCMTANAKPVETTTDYRHTHKELGLVMVNVYGFVFHESSLL